MATLSQQIAVHPLSPGRYASELNPVRLGSLTSTSFGGSSLAVAISAAYHESRRDFHLYSIGGYFIRPAMTDRKLFCHVENIRHSKSFETKEIRVSQEYEDGSSKVCLVALADFHVTEPRSMVVFSTAPELIPLPALKVDQYLKALSRNVCHNSDLYRDIEKFIEMKPLLASSLSNFEGRGEETSKLCSQPINAEVFRARELLKDEGEQISALSFYMDKGLAYNAALHHGHHPSEAKACASLDFSLRFFEHAISLEDWHYTEQKSFVANHARVYSEGRVWDERGRLLAAMTQQTILRPNSTVKTRL